MSNTVLIITGGAEDAQVIGNTLETAEDGPFATEWVRSLSDGITRVKQGEIDIILVDLFLPDSQGIATFDVLFKEASPIPIVTLSPAEDDELAVEAVQRGAQGFLTKGYFRTSLVPQALRNVVHRKRVEDALFAERERARVTLESIGDGVLSTDVAGNVTYLNKEAERLTGWVRDDAMGRPVAEILNLVDGTTLEPARNPVDLVMQQGKPMGLYANSVLVRKDGYKTPIEDSVAPIFNQRANVIGAVVTFHDTSEMNAMVQKMAHLAQHDYLTGLPNRLLLTDRLNQAIAYAERHGASLALLYLDLDNFKHINDSLGHATGDMLLKSVADRLVAQVRHSDTVSRQGGDEFVILVLEETQAEDAMSAAEKILRALAQPHHLGGHELHVTTSIGISLYPADGRDTDTLVKSADIAMYHAKEKGRATFQFFKEEMNVRAVQRQSIEADLRLALERNEFVLHYQPKVNLKSREITGVEALIRWRHPSKGLILPDAFIPIAEECGLIVPIGQSVLRQACTQAKAWFDNGMRPLSIAVNISAIEFRSKDFYQFLRDMLRETGLDPASLELELTETALMRNVESSRKVLDALKAEGIRIAVDDFGTGYSSLSYLSQFKIDVLKIDKSFVQDISLGTENGIIVNAVIGMGTSLKQRVIAEGVETPEQFAFLSAHNCEEGQGNFFSSPVPADEFLHLLNH
ncbi:EAL domain-containing protein [Oxalobacteraceae bacterium OM1]|nr:EAL domain-containing protein [Oxalobacteraceae bacterium OM1]